MEVIEKLSTPEEHLAHYGVKGMKWGVRKDQSVKGELILKKECKNGSELRVHRQDPNRFESWLASKSERVAESQALSHKFKFFDKNGDRIGEASFLQSSSTKLDLEWVGVRKQHRSNGYARAALEGVLDYAKDNGITELELHSTKMGQTLYESLGFIYDPKTESHRLSVPPSVRHSDDSSAEALADLIVARIDATEELSEIEHGLGKNVRQLRRCQMQTIDKMGSPEEYLEHYGIKGMKWGVRRSDAELDRNAERRSSSPSNRSGMSRETKRKVAAGAAAVGVVALGVGLAYAAKSGKINVGKKTSDDILKKLGKTTLKAQKKHSKVIRKLPLDQKSYANNRKKLTTSVKRRDSKMDSAKSKAIKNLKKIHEQKLKDQEAYRRQVLKDLSNKR